jgi:methylenetetrahydrofolate dehydrogenase (NADP+) / methenyltetrahydrofolate cyclohydrolase
LYRSITQVRQSAFKEEIFVTAVIMDTRPIAATLRNRLRQDVIAFNRQYNQTPGLVMLGSCEDQATVDYVRMVGRVALELNLRYTAQLFPSHSKASELRRFIQQHNQDPSVHAISLQLPLPPHLDLEEIASFISVEKDVEGLHPTNMGRTLLGKPFLAPPSALGATKLMALYNINPTGRHVVIVGRSPETARPLACMLTKADATVTLCHSLTHHLLAHTRQAEILITVAGQPGLIKAEMVRPGAVVLDYGMNYSSKAQLVGDVAFEQVLEVAAAVTPMPGGTGPLTTICLMENVLKAARFQLSMEVPNVTRPTGNVEQPVYSARADSNNEVAVKASLFASRGELALSGASDTTGRNNLFNN